jgi:RNA polymerase sigma-70 factor, ECF subfamily
MSEMKTVNPQKLLSDKLNDKIEEIYNKEHQLLMSFIIKRVPNRVIAEDILQEVFIKVHNNIDKLLDKNKIKSWLFQITRNSIIDYYRKEEPVESLNEELMGADNPAEEDAYKRLQLSVLEMIQQLPFKDRQALFLADYKGLSQKEIAEKLDVTHSCIKSRVQRARRKMKQIYIGCCHFEFDRNGRVLDYYDPNPTN